MRYWNISLLLWLSPVAKGDFVTVDGPSGVSYLGVRNTTRKQDAFYGIPFAQPPTGALRFKPPQPWAPTNTTTLVNATTNDRPICMQSAPITYDATVSEDCLYLSLWRPNNITTKLPVMVFIYGGGFLNGSAPAYPGDRILDAAFRLDKPVLYLAMNYRLGIYGFPPGQESEDAGALNLGLKDQRLALEWVNKNIELFGGDPTKVMIFGESAGAMSNGTNAKRGSVIAAYDFILNATGCAGSNFECLRNADTEALKQANYDVFKLPPNLLSLDPYPTAVGPTLSASDPFLSRSPRQSVWEGKFAKIPFVCGTNLDEGTLFTTNPNTTQDVVSFLTTQLPGLTFGIDDTTIVEQLLNYYPVDPSAGSPYNTGSTKRFLTSGNEIGYFFMFAQTGLAPDSPELGVPHASEILFVVQYLPEEPQSNVELGITVIDYWLSLAHNLDPSETGNPDLKLENQLAGGLPTVETHSTLKYPYRLNFYDEPPLCNVTLEEFETWGIQRLRVLAEIESCNVRNRTFEDTKLVALAQSKKHLPLSSTSAISVNRDLERKRDHVSHFVLRLAFCRTEELRRRFVQAETTLFKIRWESDDKSERSSFLNSLDLGMIPVPPEQLKSIQPTLQAASGIRPPKNDQPPEPYFKVHWTRVTDLVATRRVYLEGGYAYVPSKDQNSIVYQEFSSRLERALEQTSRAVPRLDEDDRLVPLLQHLTQSFINGIASSSAASYADENGELVRAEQVDELAVRHFPACMRNLHDTLRKDHHLRHHGRLQYGLFLKVSQAVRLSGSYKIMIDVYMRRVRKLRAIKAIGMSVEEALTFWRRGFQGGKVTDDKFAKEYRYNIRHSYGLEGRRMNYPAKNCVRIITQDEPSSLDNHGCPFRHFSPQNLTAMLERSYRITSTSEQAEIVKLVQGHHYQIACTRVFEYTHRKAGTKSGGGLDGQGETVDHPNRYYTRSRELSKPTDKDKDNMDIDAKPPVKGESD
ncbi:unnamed protein product [Rhizoctonia solani]|uniref:DNA primase large subunit n=1 Tax=Rhizoctonia solani TaxID=456999 RepID=A0A8H3BBR5_9AGAM|nr:unnamed protein product [Rhizoctonia solani]